jgi:hypothetical protein
MVHWQEIAVNSLWVFGLAMLLAVLSYENWFRSQTVDHPSQASRSGNVERFFYPALGLISLSLLLLATVWWEQLIWLIFMGWSVVSAWRLWQRR